VYDSSTQAARAIDFVLTVQRGIDGRTVFTARDHRQMAASKGVATEGFTTEIPLKDWKPGIYVLRVDATSTPGGLLAARAVPFEVTSEPASGKNP
jgi:hypothetical protein